MDCKYTIVRNYVATKKSEFNNKVTIRFETMPGLQAQVDWAHFEDRHVIVNNAEKKLYCFLIILGYSRMRYIEFVTDMTTTTLIRCHINAFRYFGGYPEEILYDNMHRQEGRTPQAAFVQAKVLNETGGCQKTVTSKRQHHE